MARNGSVSNDAFQRLAIQSFHKHQVAQTDLGLSVDDDLTVAVSSLTQRVRGCPSAQRNLHSVIPGYSDTVSSTIIRTGIHASYV